jgi:hypothetical protein
MRYLIDGYNLMHYLGFTPRPGGYTLERARVRLLEWLAETHRGDASSVAVVFDAKNGRKSRRVDENVQGIRVLFAVGQLADDLIESMVQAEAAPQSLTVVSSDSRIREAARRRGCLCRTSSDYVEEMMSCRSTPAAPPPAASAKPEGVSAVELEEWLKVFGAG